MFVVHLIWMPYTNKWTRFFNTIDIFSTISMLKWCWKKKNIKKLSFTEVFIWKTNINWRRFNSTAQLLVASYVCGAFLPKALQIIISCRSKLVADQFLSWWWKGFGEKMSTVEKHWYDGIMGKSLVRWYKLCAKIYSVIYIHYKSVVVD